MNSASWRIYSECSGTSCCHRGEDHFHLAQYKFTREDSQHLEMRSRLDWKITGEKCVKIN